MDWPALEAARRADRPRVPFRVAGQRVGSVATANLPALKRWPRWVTVDDEGVRLIAEPASRDAVLAEIHARLREEGLIVAWRDETYPILTRLGAPPLARIERAAARFWGTLTFGAHCNGYVADRHGRPAHLWIARRSMHKPTDPGLLDNLVGGGVPDGQTPFETLVREGFEEAGLDETTMRRAQPGRVIALRCDIVEGFMQEDLHCFDLVLEPGRVPANQDGEVESIRCLPVAEAIDRAAAGEMTVDASLVTLDFALRHRLLAGPAHAQLAARLAPLLGTD